MENTGYYDLAIAIISIAVSDYYELATKYTLDDTDKYNKDNIEDFLMNSPIMDAIDMDGEIIINRLDRMADKKEKLDIAKGWYC